MFQTGWMFRAAFVALAVAVAIPFGAAGSPDLNPAAISYKLPDQIPWKEYPVGMATYDILGDPSKPGLYIELTKWHAHHNSHPHYHPNDRYITVLSGTWWVNTGSHYDTDHMVPLPSGSVAVHYGKQVHYDGAKDGDVILEVVGQGPAPQIPVEEK